MRAATEDARRRDLSVRQLEESARQSQSAPMELLMRTSLRTWVMEPMEPTAGIRESTGNEPIVLLYLPRFFETHGSEISNNLQNDIARTTDLHCDSEFTVMAASPDTVCGLNLGDQLVRCAVEDKTTISSKTNEDAKDILERYSYPELIKR